MTASIQPADSLCPHFEDIDEELISSLFSEVAKVRSDNRELFEFTHRQITVFDEKADEETLTEREILELLEAPRTRNRAVIIEGNVGTGKSELCAYLSHQLQAAEYPVLHISKNADLLSIMAEEIPAFYREHTGKVLEGARKLDQLQTDIKQNRETVASLVVAKAILNISNLGDSPVSLASEERSQLEGFVTEKLDSIVERGSLAKEVRFVEPGEVSNFTYLNVFENASNEDAADNWDEAIWSAIREEYETPTMDTLLERASEGFNDRRPVIVFEDFSVSALDAKRLQRYIEEDSTDGAWDFIIAGTQDSIDVLKTNTAWDRDWIRFYRTNIQDSSQVLFLDEESAFDFIRPYLGYIKQADGSVGYERDEQLVVTDLNDPAQDSLCAQCGFCDAAFRDVFPFNRTFLERVYAGLDTEEKRPRRYVQTVFNILRDYYRDFEASPASSDELDNLGNEIRINDSVYANDDLRRLAQWYGTETEDGGISVDRRFATAFGFEDDVDYDTLGVTIDSTDTELRFPTPDSPGGGGGTGAEGGTGGGGSTKSKEERRFDEVKQYLDTWRSNTTASSAAKVDDYMRVGLKQALERLTDGFKLETGGALEYFIGGNQYPFVFSDGAPAQPYQISIDPKSFTTSDLLEVLRFGIYRDMDPRSADWDHLFNTVGSQLSSYAVEWRQQIRDELLVPDNLYRSSKQHRTFEQFVFGAYGTLVLLSNPWERLTVDRLHAYYTDEHSLELDAGLKSVLDMKLPADSYASIVDAFETYADSVERLFGETFGVTENVFDASRLRELLWDEDPLEIINDITKSAISKLPTDLRFGTSTTLENLGEAIYNVNDALDDLSDDEDSLLAARFIAAELRDSSTNSERATINKAALDETITKIRAYDQVSADLNEKLGRIQRYPQSTVNDLHRAATISLKMADENTHQSNIQSRLAGLKIWDHELTNLLLNIEWDDVSVSTDAFGQFEEVATHYVE